jgi:hypothetical protein
MLHSMRADVDRSRGSSRAIRLTFSPAVPKPVYCIARFLSAVPAKRLGTDVPMDPHHG